MLDRPDFMNAIKHSLYNRDIMQTAEVIVKEVQKNQKILNNINDLQWGEAIIAGKKLSQKIEQDCGYNIWNFLVIDDNSCPQVEYSQYIEVVNQVVGEVNDTPPNSECCVIL